VDIFPAINFVIAVIQSGLIAAIALRAIEPIIMPTIESMKAFEQKYNL